MLYSLIMRRRIQSERVRGRRRVNHQNHRHKDKHFKGGEEESEKKDKRKINGEEEWEKKGIGKERERQ